MTARHADLLVKNASILTLPGEEPVIDVAICGGRITGFARPGFLAGEQELDVEGRTVVPGLIDPHVHLGNGRQSIEEDLRTETRMAAAGGATTVCPYVISPQGYDDILRELREAVPEQSLVDVFPQLGIVSPEQIAEVPRLHKAFGVRAFKCFMGYKGADASPSGIRGIDDASILELMRQVAQIPGGRLAVHPENMEIVDAARRRAEAEDPDGQLSSWTRSRPSIAETEAIQRVLQFARVTGCPVTIPHISVGNDVAMLRGHARGLDAVFETCPHYLLLSCDDDIDVWGKVNPPLRSAVQQAALWEAVESGAIDVVGSDHCPFDPETKGAKLWSARAGIPNGTALTLPALVDRMTQGDGLSIERVVDVTSRTAALRYRLDGKGALAVGADADLAILEPGVNETFDSSSLGGVATRSAYDGMTFYTKVWATVARGVPVYVDGSFCNGRRERSARLLLDRVPRG